MSLLTYLILKSADILTAIYFVFPNEHPRPTWKAFNTKFGPKWKDTESSYQLRRIVALFYKLVALGFG